MCNFLSERAAQLLGSAREHSLHSIVGIAQTPLHTKGLTKLHVSSLSGHTVSTQHPFHILSKISADLPRTHLSPEVFKRVKTFSPTRPFIFLVPLEPLCSFTYSHMLRPILLVVRCLMLWALIILDSSSWVKLHAQPTLLPSLISQVYTPQLRFMISTPLFNRPGFRKSFLYVTVRAQKNSSVTSTSHHLITPETSMGVLECPSRMTTPLLDIPPSWNLTDLS